MTKLIWPLQILVAVAFLAVGTMKLTQARADIVAMGATYAQDYSDAQIKLIGAAEVAGKFGRDGGRTAGRRHLAQDASTDATRELLVPRP